MSEKDNDMPEGSCYRLRAELSQHHCASFVSETSVQSALSREVQMKEATIKPVIHLLQYVEAIDQCVNELKR